ncbi:MAG: ribokinase [Gemmatimonadetes bacterium]|jgi:ribokinase|nr:ribokinase [Gemmatimonadota bacterium]MBT4609654.1 ribokinase [Gemmatimonadota bacterium]MBT5055799.1 ribokinase [Gemmatimonadota bacterium]MBT5143714.1 ribokinase [Gemmatimonadota bacterium]MBT5588574.1 ribokinase [Gemmatimonadota bacterium]
MRKILNFGSLNIDHVYTVPGIVQPGQTLPSSTYQIHSGGKGGNQSAALAKAGAEVFHAGRVGTDGIHLLEHLESLGVDTHWTIVDPLEKTGHAIIQVEDQGGENAILLYPGANYRIDLDQISSTIDDFFPDSILLLQNEISNIASLLDISQAHSFEVVLNPAPYTPDLGQRGHLEHVDLLIVNESEAAGICDAPAESGGPLDAAKMLAALRCHVRDSTQILLTLGTRGAILDAPGQRQISVAAYNAGPALDTTAAGDTFIGFFLAARAAGSADEVAMHRARVAAALCVTAPGAMDSIPSKSQVDALTHCDRDDS